MAKIFHYTCRVYRFRKFMYAVFGKLWLKISNKGIPRYAYLENLPGDKIVHVQSFKCEGCGHKLLIDTDMYDEKGGIIGAVNSKFS